MSRRIEAIGELYTGITASVPQLRRGKVWCITCGYSQHVDSADALQRGWPKCCGSTMTIDGPAERRALKRKAQS